ncbi:MAG: VapC toxin family PIN domain ribonuclease [Desulfobacca sp.]|nr:VapC toxin family PIN domain ribonuclease [Desulfobacca sp.]
MPALIVDASALGALIFGEPQAKEMAEKLSEGPMTAPALLWFELASLCLKKIKTHPHLEIQLLEAFDLAADLEIKIVEIDHVEVVQLARRIGLTAYDANYLWLTRKLNGKLVTLDADLLKKSKKASYT